MDFFKNEIYVFIINIIGDIMKCLKNSANINDGINLNYLEDCKFKTTTTLFLFRTNIKRKDVTKNALLAEILKKSSKRYPQVKNVCNACEYMFGSVFDIYILKKGEEQIICFYFECLKIDSNFSTSKSIINFFKEIIFNPLVESDMFMYDVYEREVNNLKAKILNSLNDKSKYAKDRCLELVCEFEAFGINCDGYISDLEIINPSMLYGHYMNILKTAPIEIMVFANKKCDTYINELKNMFDYKREGIKEVNAINVLKNNVKPKKIVEILEGVSQGKLNIAFRTSVVPSSKLFFALLVFNEIFGVGSSSMLFSLVREREGFCYFINSYVYAFKGIVMVETGIDEENVDKTIEISYECINNIVESDITNNVIKAKKSLLNYYENIFDSPTNIIDFYTDEILKNGKYDIDDFVYNIKNVLIEDVKIIAEDIVLDTAYYLYGG